MGEWIPLSFRLVALYNVRRVLRASKYERTLATKLEAREVHRPFSIHFVPLPEERRNGGRYFRRRRRRYRTPGWWLLLWLDGSLAEDYVSETSS